jgi:hypothetical protein
MTRLFIILAVVPSQYQANFTKLPQESENIQKLTDFNLSVTCKQFDIRIVQCWGYLNTYEPQLYTLLHSRRRSDW